MIISRGICMTVLVLVTVGEYSVVALGLPRLRACRVTGGRSRARGTPTQ